MTDSLNPKPSLTLKFILNRFSFFTKIVKTYNFQFSCLPTHSLLRFALSLSLTLSLCLKISLSQVLFLYLCLTHPELLKESAVCTKTQTYTSPKLSYLLFLSLSHTPTNTHNFSISLSLFRSHTQN